MHLATEGRYARWANATPPDFRFAVKLPKAVTHVARLRGMEALLRPGEPLARFLDEVGGLGSKLAVLLVQLPPSLAFDEGVVTDALETLRANTRCGIAVEPRHASWFVPEAERLLARQRVARDRILDGDTGVIDYVPVAT